MKRSLKLTAVSMFALALAGGLWANLLAGTNADKGAPAAADQSSASGTGQAAPAPISEHAMASINDIQLARLAINDGYTDKAAELLKDAETLLKKVDDENEQATVSAEANIGNKPAQQHNVTSKHDLIPILSEVRFFEALVGPAIAQPAPSAAGGTQADPAATDSKPVQGDQGQSQAAFSHSERMAASQKAREQLHSGDREGAVETLKTVELGLATRVVSMPLKETHDHLKEAISLLNKRKYHDANLALKAIEDGLVVSTDLIVEPVGDTVAPTSASPTAATPAGKTSDQKD